MRYLILFVLVSLLSGCGLFNPSCDKRADDPFKCDDPLDEW